MRTQQLVQMYEKGAVTPHHLVLEFLNMIDPANVGEVLEALPPRVYPELVAFIEEYRPGKMVANYGQVPPPESVRLAKHWLENRSIHQRCGPGAPTLGQRNT